MESCYLFLDLDGVTHPWPTKKMFDQECIKSISEAVSDFELKIVVTSTWREKITLDKLSKKLIKIGKPIVGVTPVIDDPFKKHIRYHEVIKYLNSVDRDSAWVAIDDTPGFYPKLSNLYVTNPKTGFTNKDISLFKALLNNMIHEV